MPVTRGNPYISTIKKVPGLKSAPGEILFKMQEKQSALIFLEFLVVVLTLGLLSAVALPHVGQMAASRNDVSMEAEFKNVHTAVAAMLRDSASGAVAPVG